MSHILYLSTATRQSLHDRRYPISCTSPQPQGSPCMTGDIPYLVPLHRHNTGRRSLFCPISPYLFLLVPGRTAQTIKSVGGLLTVVLSRLAARSLSDVLRAARLCSVCNRHPCWSCPDVIVFQWLPLLCGPCIPLPWLVCRCFEFYPVACLQGMF
jgi:hypothetical protein